MRATRSPDLRTESPRARTRTEADTQPLRLPNRLPSSADPEYTTDQLLEIARAGAAGAAPQLLNSTPLLTAICRLLVSRMVPRIHELSQLATAQRQEITELQLQSTATQKLLVVAQGQARIDQYAVDRARNEHQVTALEREVLIEERQDLLDQRDMLTEMFERISYENVLLRHRLAGTVPVEQRLVRHPLGVLRETPMRQLPACKDASAPLILVDQSITNDYSIVQQGCVETMLIRLTPPTPIARL